MPNRSNNIYTLLQEFVFHVEYTLFDPGEIGVVMITSESDRVSAKEMVKEFGITLLDDYFNKSRSFRVKHLKQE